MGPATHDSATPPNKPQRRARLARESSHDSTSAPDRESCAGAAWPLSDLVPRRGTIALARAQQSACVGGFRAASAKRPHRGSKQLSRRRTSPSSSSKSNELLTKLTENPLASTSASKLQPPRRPMMSSKRA